MQDQDLIDLCKTIYRKHREAVDLIVEYGASSGVQDAVEEEIKSLISCEFVIQKGGRAVWFLPNEMAKPMTPTVELSGWAHLPRKVPLMWWFYFGKKSGKLGLILEVGPIADGPTRTRLLKAIKQKDFAVPKHAFKDGAKFTRILSEYQELQPNDDGEPDDDPDYVKSVAKSLWTNLWAEGAKITEVLKDFDWGGVR